MSEIIRIKYRKKHSNTMLSAVSSLSASESDTEEEEEKRNYIRTLNREVGVARVNRHKEKRKQQQQQQQSSDVNAIDLHHDLKEASWLTLHHHLEYLFTNSNLILPTFMKLNSKDNGTPLHTAVWQAPPSLALMLIKLLQPSATNQMKKSDLNTIYMHKDRDANTALHLCCGNLDVIQDEAALEAAMKNKTSSASISSIGTTGMNTSVLEALIRVAPRALQIQNIEGDTPLHMLVSSPACCSCSDTSSSSPALSSSGVGGMNDPATIATATARIVAILIDTCLDAALMQDSTGATPLHAAIANNANDKVLMQLLKAAPMACKVEDNRNMLPLHYAAAFQKTSPSVLQKMIECHPESIVHQTVNGDTPLHLAISNANATLAEDGGGSVVGKEDAPSLSSNLSTGKIDRNITKMVELLMGRGKKDGYGGDGIVPTADQQNPLIVFNGEQLTPLHCCAIFDAPPALTRLLMTHPSAKQAAAMTTSHGATPLHLATAHPGVALSIATVMAVGTPDAAAIQDRLKRTPLHVAAQNTHSTKILIKTLAELYPEATAIKTQRGHLPLHLAAQSQAKEHVVKALIKAFPQAAEARNKSINTPLHDAAKYRSSAGVVKLLLDTYPEAVYIQNQYGNLPLHCATAYQAPEDAVQLLIEAWPDGASMQNRNGDAPLHYAAAHATSVDAVKLLIDAAPASVLLLNTSSQSPIDRAKANNSSQEIIDLLEASTDAWTKKAASDGFGTF
mmetsp:Transcript_53328/g.79679  ORF Transcript_53328/g.79679 Transcript_53328/m.79679 type:complete len:735 (-) Transcript_53328:616-2820(-)